MKGRAAQGKFELLVVGKYKSNEVWDLLLSPGDLLYNSSYFTDYRILEKAVVTPLIIGTLRKSSTKMMIIIFTSIFAMSYCSKPMICFMRS